MERIENLLDQLESEISSIEHRLQCEMSLATRWDLISILEDKRTERNLLIAQLSEEVDDL